MGWYGLPRDEDIAQDRNYGEFVEAEQVSLTVSVGGWSKHLANRWGITCVSESGEAAAIK